MVESERLKKFITYGYLLAFFAFVAGIFNPLTNPNADPVAVLIGILVLIVGLVGGIQLILQWRSSIRRSMHAASAATETI